MLEGGCSINAGDYDRRTACTSVSEGRLDMACILVDDFKAFISPKDRFGGTLWTPYQSTGVEAFLAAVAKGGKTATSASVTVAADLCDAAYAGNATQLASGARALLVDW